MSEYESIILVKHEVFVYRIPPRTTNRGYRAADWKLDAPDWTGRMRLVATGERLLLKLEDKTSGELFAKCPIEAYPSVAVEGVLDSSRYFVIRLVGDDGRTAFIGLGFQDRGDSFDFNVAIQDHFKHVQQEKDAAQSAKELESGPKLDLGFKEGETIKIQLNTKRAGDGPSKRPRASRPAGAPGGLGLLPPPPSGSASRQRASGEASAGSASVLPPPPAPAGASNVDLLVGLAEPPPASAASASPSASSNANDWMNF